MHLSPTTASSTFPRPLTATEMELFRSHALLREHKYIARLDVKSREVLLTFRKLSVSDEERNREIERVLQTVWEDVVEVDILGRLEHTLQTVWEDVVKVDILGRLVRNYSPNGLSLWNGAGAISTLRQLHHELEGLARDYKLVRR